MSEPKQARLFDPERYSIVGAGVHLLLPESSSKTLTVAAALGRAHRRDSTFAPLRSGKDADCVVIEKAQREYILAQLNMKPRLWHYYVDQWVRKNVAHRCARGVLCLWLKPLEDPCPYCKKEPRRSANQLHKKVQATDTSSVNQLHSTVPNSGAANGMKKGDEGVGPGS